VTVILVLPERLDSKLARFAGQACFDGLLEAGVQIWRYEPDLLHTKTITVDRRLAIIGSVNLDMRSLWLNFEISLAVYDPDTAQQIRRLQSGYLAESVQLHPEAWGRRPRTERMAEGVLRLLGPLL
jgi:cardiolipin synthase